MLKQVFFTVLAIFVGLQVHAQASSPPVHKKPFYAERPDFVKAADLQAASVLSATSNRLQPKPQLSGGSLSKTELEEQIQYFQSKITEALVHPAQYAEQILIYTETVSRLKQSLGSSK
jgi:hypothetical protein